MAVRTMADGNIGVYVLTTAPAAQTGVPTVAELTVGTDALMLPERLALVLEAVEADVVSVIVMVSVSPT